ncbi:ribosome-associated translation inhibitor RaiA [bacterium]|nr:ribosome-associated translation inhibitor RaiA [bacterium]MBT5015272.1 ribosome-associated translation inhibitor RaiA [bacterium]
MEKRITFKGMDHSVSIENFINDKLAKIEKLLLKEKGPIFFDIVMNMEHSSKLSDVEIRINGPHFSLVAHDQEREMYSAIEKTIDKMAKEITKMKDKRRDEERNGDSYKSA